MPETPDKSQDSSHDSSHEKTIAMIGRCMLHQDETIDPDITVPRDDERVEATEFVKKEETGNPDAEPLPVPEPEGPTD